MSHRLVSMADSLLAENIALRAEVERVDTERLFWREQCEAREEWLKQAEAKLARVKKELEELRAEHAACSHRR